MLARTNPTCINAIPVTFSTTNKEFLTSPAEVEVNLRRFEPGWRLIVWELLSCHLQNDEKAINYLSLRGGIFSSDRSRLLTEQGGLPMYSASSE
jgi:hypothetical protein